MLLMCWTGIAFFPIIDYYTNIIQLITIQLLNYFMTCSVPYENHVRSFISCANRFMLSFIESVSSTLCHQLYVHFYHTQHKWWPLIVSLYLSLISPSAMNMLHHWIETCRLLFISSIDQSQVIDHKFNLSFCNVVRYHSGLWLSQMYWSSRNIRDGPIDGSFCWWIQKWVKTLLKLRMTLLQNTNP